MLNRQNYFKFGFLLGLVLSGIAPKAYANTPVCQALFDVSRSQYVSTTQVLHVAGRSDWKVDVETTAGDPRQPLVVIANGFVWPRENSDPFKDALLHQNQGAPAYNVVRYDMSGQGRTMALFPNGSEAPWFMKEEITLDKLRREMSEVTKASLQKLKLPPDHPLVFVGISFGRSVLPENFFSQAQLVLELAPMIRSLDHYHAEGAGLRATLNMMRLNPFLISAANTMQANSWRAFYTTFYAQNSSRVPENIPVSWLTEASAMRTNAAMFYHAKDHVLAPRHVLTVSEIDDRPLIVDQLKYFRDHLSKNAQATLIYMRKTEHGVSADPIAAQVAVQMMTTALNAPVSSANTGKVFDLIRADDGRVELRPTTIEALLSHVESRY